MMLVAYSLILFAILAQEGGTPRRSARFGFLVPTTTAALSQTPTSGVTQKENTQDDVVRVTTTLVTVPVSVMDRNGKYILDLSRQDFHIYEDGAEQEIANFDSTEKAFTIALLLDISDSMRFRIGDIQSAAILFVNQLRREDRVMVIAFDSQVRVLLEPTMNHDLARNSISRINQGGGTRVLIRRMKSHQADATSDSRAYVPIYVSLLNLWLEGSRGLRRVAHH